LQAINAEGQNDELKNLYNSDEKIQQAADLAEKLE
jgi:hypothetical protein